MGMTGVAATDRVGVSLGLNRNRDQIITVMSNQYSSSVPQRGLTLKPLGGLPG